MSSIAGTALGCRGSVWGERKTDQFTSINLRKQRRVQLTVHFQRTESINESDASQKRLSPDPKTALAVAATEVTSRFKLAVEAELAESWNQFETNTLQRPLAKLLKDGSTLVNLAAAPSGRLFRDFVYNFSNDNAPLPFNRFAPGQSVLLFQQLQPTIYENSKDKLRNVIDTTLAGIEATVVKATSTCLSVAISGDDTSKLRPGIRYCILSMTVNTVTAKRQLEALESLQNKPSTRGEALLRAILLELPQADTLSARPPAHAQDPSFREAARVALEELTSDLNQSQKVAVASALLRTFSLWQGPPGTGKTKTLNKYIAVLVYICSQLPTHLNLLPILAVAETNTAADNILEGLLENKVRAVRSGVTAKVRPHLQHVTVDALVERSPQGKKAQILRNNVANSLLLVTKGYEQGKVTEKEWKDMQRDMRRTLKEADLISEEAAKSIMRQSPVIVTTCSSAGDARLQDMRFPVVCIDEASQATEPSSLIPIMKGCEMLIMAGDQAQLAPTITSQKPAAQQLSLTLFNRLAQNGLDTFLLDKQYRMHPEIARFPSMKFYNGKVTSGVSAKDRPLVNAEPWTSNNFPVVFINSDHPEQRAQSTAANNGGDDSASYKNSGQAKLVFKYLQNVLADDSVQDVAILTPYNGQLRLLNAMLREHMPELFLPSTGNKTKNIEVSTVDGFQGQEADVVIFSTVRCNPERKCGFLNDKRRLNVAITRARRGLLVIGNQDTLESDSNWKAWFTWLGIS